MSFVPEVAPPISEAAIEARITASRDAANGFKRIARQVCPTMHSHRDLKAQRLGLLPYDVLVGEDTWVVAGPDDLMPTHRLLRCRATIHHPDSGQSLHRLHWLSVKVMGVKGQEPRLYHDAAAPWVGLVDSPYYDPERFPQIYARTQEALAAAELPDARQEMIEFSWALHGAGKNTGFTAEAVRVMLGSCLQIL